MLTRREFLRTSSLLALAPTVPAFLRQAAWAATPGADNRVLVVVQLTGGNDGFNTVVPFGDDAYARHRRKLRLPAADCHKIADGLGLHSAMRDAAALFDEQRLAIVQGVGYPGPSRSHDVSMAVWQTAMLDRESHDGHGWLGRTLDKMASSEHGASRSMFIGKGNTPVALRGRQSTSSTFDSLDDLLTNRKLRAGGRTTDHGASDLANYMRQTTLDAYATAEMLAELARRDRSSSSAYRDSKLASHLRLIAQLLKADLGTRVFYTQQTSYDTHAAQLGTHANLLRDLSRSLKVFLADLSAAGLDERVVVMCFSEFGRQLGENASEGTDHGTAGPVLLCGTPVTGGIHGAIPDLGDLENNAPHHTTDFRQVYASLLQDWLGIRANRVLGETFASLPLIS